MAGMLMRERVDVAARLGAALRQRNVRPKDIDVVEALIDDESTSMNRAQTIADTDSFKESYRTGQRVAAENSRAVIGHLEKALEALVAKDPIVASAALTDAATYRQGKREQRRGNTTRSVSALYTEYLAHKDKDFHSWLATHGHSDVLEGMGVQAPVLVRRKTRGGRSLSRVAAPRGNNPEDY